MTKASALNPFFEEPGILAFRRALLALDLPAAEREISNPEIHRLSSASGSIADPVTLYRAYIAYLLGKKDAARGFAEEAIATYRRTIWTRRQKPRAHMGIAQAEAYAGNTDEAVRDRKAALDEMIPMDALESPYLRIGYGQILVIAGRSEEALSELTALATLPFDEPPRDLAFDPVWSRLKGNPRFQAIIDSFKPL